MNENSYKPTTSSTEVNDAAVAMVQEWLNDTYGSNANFETLKVDGVTGNNTCKALVRAIQIELNISPVDGIWGDGTSAAFAPLSINSDFNDPSIQRQIYILQGGFFCKGIHPGAFDGVFGESTASAVCSLESLAGLSSTTGIASAMIMKALLNTDAYTLLDEGDSNIRTIQQSLNNQYNSYIGLIPCDGIFSRRTSKALITALQVEEKKTYSTVVVDGIWGSDTMNKCPTLQRYGSVTNRQYVYILQYALYANGYNPNGFDGAFGAGVQTAVTNFQAFVGLSADGIVGKQTWASLMVSYGDPDRTCTAADCMQPLTAETVQLLVADGKTAIGRYLMGGSDKRLSLEELKIIHDAGLKVIPIYQTSGNSREYFTEINGNLAGYNAFLAYRRFHFPDGGTVYFAVDYDALTTDIDNYIIPYFQAIKKRLDELGNTSFSIGVYGPRYVCTRLREAGLTSSSFVSDMSSGFSCNIGYPLPQDWAFDQIKNTWLGGRTLEIDNDVASSRDTSISVDPDIYLETPNPVLAELQMADAIANCIGCNPNIIGLDLNYDIYTQFFASEAMDIYFVLSHTLQSEGDLAFSLSVENGTIQNPEVMASLGELSAQIEPIVSESVDYTGIAAAISDGLISFDVSLEMVGEKLATSLQITVNVYHNETNELSQDLAVGFKFVIKDTSKYSDSLYEVNPDMDLETITEYNAAFAETESMINDVREQEEQNPNFDAGRIIAIVLLAIVVGYMGYLIFTGGLGALAIIAALLARAATAAAA